MKKIFLLSIGMFVLGMDAYIVAGLLPSISISLNVSLSAAGQAVSVFTFFYALAAPFFATLFAGKPVRRILIIALSIFSVANVLSAIAGSLSSLLVARAIAGTGAGLYAPLAVAAAATLSSTQRRGRSLGIILGGMSTGTVIGVPLGIMFSNYLGWQSTLWLIALFSVIGLIGILFWFPNIPATIPPSLRQRVAMLTDRRVAVVVGITFLTSVASLGLYTYIASILKSFGITHVVLYLWVWGLGGVIGSFSIGKLIDVTGRPQYLMVMILILMAIAMFSLIPALNFHLLQFIPLFMWGAVGWASQAPQQYILLLLQPKHGSVAVALNSSANYLGSSVGACLGGMFLLAGFAPTQLPVIAAIVILIALVSQLYILVVNRNTQLNAVIS